MKRICFILQIHHPYRLHSFAYQKGLEDEIFYDKNYGEELSKLGRSFYIPLSDQLLELNKIYGDRFRFCISVSGTALDLFEKYAPEVLSALKQLAITGRVEFTGGTYSNSLSGFKSENVLSKEIKLHSKRIKELFHILPSVFTSTSLINTRDVENVVAGLGFQGMLADASDKAIRGKNIYRVFQRAGDLQLKLLPVHHFKPGEDYYSGNMNFYYYLNSIADNAIVPVYIRAADLAKEKVKSLQSFLEGVFSFTMKSGSYKLSNPNELIADSSPAILSRTLHFENAELTFLLGNVLQYDAFDTLYKMEEKVIESNDQKLFYDWMTLQSAEHFLLMNEKCYRDKKYLKEIPYNSPYEAFVKYMEAARVFRKRLEAEFTRGSSQSFSYKKANGPGKLAPDIFKLEEYRNN